MRRFKFTVLGNPVPYKRMTQGQVKLMRIPYHKLRLASVKVVDGIKRYLDYKDIVRYSAIKEKFERAPKEKVYLHVMIYFKNKAHGDPENVRKGIQDALFEQDKYVAGSVDFDYDADNSRCEIVIEE